ncbi:MAG: hypothetical protein MR663_05370 [Lachnospiraceae bacterium]|nr:hypothetical protein [Lachnospiraceae bacterium]
MEGIETFLSQIVTLGLEWIWSVSWYWIPAGLGFAFRFGLLKYKIWDSEMRVKAILRDIVIIFALTILWSGLNSYELDSNAVVMVFILTFVYIAYGLAESCEETGGSTESILLILKSVLLTMLSFQEIVGTIFGAIVTIGMAVMAYKFWICKEKKTDLFEIIFLCVEAVVLSIIGEIYNIQGIGIFLFIFFEETALFLLNYIVRYIASVFFGEAEENYY